MNARAAAAHRRSRRRTAARRPARRRLLAHHVAHLDGLEHDRASARRSRTALGGARALARLTGSRAFERFTGPQIRKFAEDEPADYAATDRVHLVSSWLASLLAGTHAAIDPGDGSGMNLMDLATKQWSPAAVQRDGARPRRQAAAARRIVDRRRDALALLAAAVRLPRRACRRLVGRQPVQPRRHRPRPRRRRRGLARNERHDLRHHVLAAPERGWHRPRLRLADRRLHGHVGLQERLAGARARAGHLRHGLGGVLGRARAHARQATAAPRCCPGSTPRLRRSSSNPASGGTGSNRPTPKPTSAPSSKRR